MFDSKICQFFEKMGMSSTDYYEDIINQFNQNITTFENMLLSIIDSKSLDKNDFNEYIQINNIDMESEYYDSLYDIFCCISLFVNYGKLHLYKFRQPEWNVPSVEMIKADFCSLPCITDQPIEFIYRGMSNKEFLSGDFGQSWTTELNIAQEFASREYNTPDGVVAKIPFNLDYVLHIAELPEYEVIIEKDAIREICVKKVE